MIQLKTGFHIVVITYLASILLPYCQLKKDDFNFITEERIFNLSPHSWKSKSITQIHSRIAYRATEVPLQYYIYRNEGVENQHKADSIYQSLKSEKVIEIEFQEENQGDLLKSEYLR